MRFDDGGRSFICPTTVGACGALGGAALLDERRADQGAQDEGGVDVDIHDRPELRPIEPIIWEEGYAGYRSEDIVAVTDTGWVKLSGSTYEPYGVTA